MSYYEDELALREAQINRKRKRNRKRILIGAGVAAGGALALNNEGIRNKVTNHLRSDSQMMNNIGNGVRKVGKGIYNNFKPSATTMSIRRGTERAADAISNYTPKYNKRRRKLANIIDDLYHSGYSDGYYASMALYHSDEMTEEERRARRKKKRRRNIALGIVGAGALGAGGYYGYKKMQKENEEMGDAIDRVTAAVKRMKSAPKPKRTVKGFRRNPGVGAYAYNKAKEAERAERDAAMNRSMNDLNDWVKTARSTMRKSAPKPKKTVKGFRRNPGTYKINPVTGDFGSYLTLHGMHIKARQRPYKK